MCRPCRHLTEMLNQKNILKEFLRKGGLRCQILSSSKIKVGDMIKVLKILINFFKTYQYRIFLKRLGDLFSIDFVSSSNDFNLSSSFCLNLCSLKFSLCSLAFCSLSNFSSHSFILIYSSSFCFSSSCLINFKTLFFSFLFF